MKRFAISAVVFILLLVLSLSLLGEDGIPTTAPMTTDLAGRAGQIALPSVFKVLCPAKGKAGTAFLHKSGAVITAAHVVEGSKPSEILLLPASGKPIPVTNLITNTDLDLALLYPAHSPKAPALPLCKSDEFVIGAQVSTWGFPAGYNGRAPLLCSGYIGGVDHVKLDNGKMVGKLVINAAFNLGNSGGPLLDIERGEVIGVVSSKLAPLPPHIESALTALKNDKTISAFVKTHPDGTKERISNSQVLAEVLEYLRSQTQLVIGYAVLSGDLKAFLKTQGIDP